MEIELSQKLGLKKGEHSKERKDSRNGYYEKTWSTLIGPISLKIPKLRHENYRPFFQPALDFLAEQRKRLCVFSFVAGLTTRMIAPLFGLLNIKPVQKSTVSVYNEKYLEEEFLAFSQKDLSGVDCPILMIDALYEDVRIGACLEKTATIVITGIDTEGFRQVLDIAVTVRESGETYQRVLSSLKRRGLKTPELIISDGHFGIRQAIRNVFSGSLWQRCAIHLIRETLKVVAPKNKSAFYARIHRCYQASDLKESRSCLAELVETFSKTEPEAVKLFKEGAGDTFTFHEFNSIPYYKIYSSNIHERLNRSIRHRTRCSEQFPNEKSYKRLVICWLKYFCNAWEKKRYLDPEQMLSVRETGRKRRISLEEQLGPAKLTPAEKITDTCFIYISCNPQTIETDTVKNQALVFLVEAVNKKDQRQLIDYKLITGINDALKYDQMVERIKDYLTDDDYLIITDYGYPELEDLIENNFPARNIQYSLKSIPIGLMAFIPPQVADSVTEIMKVFNHLESRNQIQTVLDSLIRLWTPILPQAASFLNNYQDYCFNFLRFTDFNCQQAATLKKITRIKTKVNDQFLLAQENMDYNDLNIKICQLIDQINLKWSGMIRVKSNKKSSSRRSSGKSRRKYVPVSELKPPRITPEMDEQWYALLRQSKDRYVG